MNYIGLDIGKESIHYCVSNGKEKYYGEIKNNRCGIDEFVSLVKGLDDESHVCCEYTGIYYLAAATALYQAGIQISVVNPYAIKSYARQRLHRNKTDKQDAGLIADYVKFFRPSLWKPMDEEIKELNAFVMRIEQLIKMRTAELNREKVSSGEALHSIRRLVEFINGEVARLEKKIDGMVSCSSRLSGQRKLLLSIPGIGKKTANVLLPLLARIEAFPSAKHLVSYLGLSPMNCQSGKSVKGLAHISKMGNPFIRKSLYMPARTACLRTKVFGAWAQRYFAKGKTAKQVYVIMMRKMVVYAYTVIKSQVIFSEQLAKVSGSLSS